MRLRLYRDKCMGCGVCVEIAPDIFEIKGGKCCFKGEEPKSVMEKEIPDEKSNEAEQAIDACPFNAISKV